MWVRAVMPGFCGMLLLSSGAGAEQRGGGRAGVPWLASCSAGPTGLCVAWDDAGHALGLRACPCSGSAMQALLRAWSSNPGSSFKAVSLWLPWLALCESRTQNLNGALPDQLSSPAAPVRAHAVLAEMAFTPWCGVLTRQAAGMRCGLSISADPDKPGCQLSRQARPHSKRACSSAGAGAAAAAACCPDSCHSGGSQK